MKPPIYREQGTLPTADLFDKLEQAVTALEPHTSPEWLANLRASIAEAKQASIANVPISRGGSRVGYAVSKADKAIACDNVMAIVKQIKATRAW